MFLTAGYKLVRTYSLVGDCSAGPQARRTPMRNRIGAHVVLFWQVINYIAPDSLKPLLAYTFVRRDEYCTKSKHSGVQTADGDDEMRTQTDGRTERDRHNMILRRTHKYLLG